MKGYKNITVTYFFTPKWTHSSNFFNFFMYMERNFKGQYYTNNRRYGMNAFYINETLSYLNSTSIGQERIQGGNLTCTDNSLLSKGQKPKEVQCEVPTENAMYTGMCYNCHQKCKFH